MTRYLFKKSGQALLAVVMVLAVLLILGAAATTLAASGKKAIVRQKEKTQAYYIAEAGVERAFLKIKQEYDWFTSLPIEENVILSELCGVNYAQGQIEEVIVKKSMAGIGTKAEVTATGSYGLARKILKVSIRIFSLANLLNGISILPPEPVLLQIGGNINIDCPDLLVNGSLALKGNSSVTGDIYASGVVSGQDQVEGLIYEDYLPFPSFPDLDQDWFRDHATAFFNEDITIGEPSGATGGQGGKQGGKQDGGQGGEQVDLDISQLTQEGIYFIDGNVTISGTYNVPAIIVATGNIEICDDLKRTDNNGDFLLTLIAFGSKSHTNGDVSVKKGNTDVEALIISYGCFDTHGNSSLYGGIVAQGLNLTGGVQVACDPNIIRQNLPEEIVCYNPLIKIKSWNEL